MVDAAQPSSQHRQSMSHQQTAHCLKQEQSRAGADPWVRASTSQYLVGWHSLLTSSECQAAPLATSEAGYDEIQWQSSLMLASHPGKSLAAWSINKMLNLQPLIYCAAF